MTQHPSTIRLWDPIDVGELQLGHRLAIASPDADFLSGQTLNVDGGKFMP